MKMILALRDDRSELFLPPFVSQTLAAAYRQLADVVSRRSDPENLIAQHPSDFALYDLGTFDEETGELVVHPMPRKLNQCSDFVVTE